jgi:type II secretory pathway predicted ATPase ExeA
MGQTRTLDIPAHVFESLVLSSRREALDIAKRAIKLGPIVITGEPGVGKTWLGQRLALEIDSPTSWIDVDLTPATSALDFLSSIASSLGLDPRGSAGTFRRSIAQQVADSSEDGVRWGLRIDEAHLATSEVVEEARVLSNRQGRDDGFHGILLIGQTGLPQKMGSGTWRSLETRLGGRLHLRPLSLDELLAWSIEFDLDRSTLDRLHRDQSGNPARLRRSLLMLPVALDNPPALDDQPLSRVESVPLLGDSKPPLVVEDGLIEVGWDDDPKSDEEMAPPYPEMPSFAPARSGVGVSSPGSTDDRKTIDDYYDALQAWNDWASSQGKSPQAAIQEPATSVPVAGSSDEETVDDDVFEQSNVWADDGQQFAPYGQLFSRARSTKDSDATD